MRLIVLGCVCAALVACTPMDNAMVTGNFNGAINLMQGHLGMSQRPDGAQAFTFVIVANAYDGVIDKAHHEKQRTEMLAGQLGRGQHCPRGYVIDKRTETKEPVHVFTYEGRCT